MCAIDEDRPLAYRAHSPSHFGGEASFLVLIRRGPDGVCLVSALSGLMKGRGQGRCNNSDTITFRSGSLLQRRFKDPVVEATFL